MCHPGYGLANGVFMCRLYEKLPDLPKAKKSASVWRERLEKLPPVSHSHSISATVERNDERSASYARLLAHAPALLTV